MCTVLTHQIQELFCHPRVVCAPEAGWLYHFQSLSSAIKKIESQQIYEWMDGWTDDKGQNGLDR